MSGVVTHVHMPRACVPLLLLLQPLLLLLLEPQLLLHVWDHSMATNIPALVLAARLLPLSVPHLMSAAIFLPASTLRTPRMTSAPWAVGRMGQDVTEAEGQGVSTGTRWRL
jgi:hypothetical protein